MARKYFKNEKDWLKFRKGKITGTMASAVVGKNPYLSTTDAWQVLLEKMELEDISTKPYVLKGKLAEYHIAELFLLDHPEYELEPLRITDAQYVVAYDKDHPYIMATPDRFIKEKKTGRKGIMEIKTTEILRSVQKESWNDNKIPMNYYIQFLQEIYCSEAEFGVFVVELKYNDNITSRRSYIIERKEVEKEIEWLINEEINFYENYVLENKRPPLQI